MACECDVIPMDVDEQYLDIITKDDKVEATKDYTELSRYDNYKDIYGENCLYNLTYDEVSEIYLEVFGEDPDLSLDKSDMIRCIDSYYTD
tara:strand:- start:2849 stop:3118 length:270 start_codon:yes stop_codon:yes gene_type:complete